MCSKNPRTNPSNLHPGTGALSVRAPPAVRPATARGTVQVTQQPLLVDEEHPLSSSDRTAQKYRFGHAGTTGSDSSPDVGETTVAKWTGERPWWDRTSEGLMTWDGDEGRMR